MKLKELVVDSIFYDGKLGVRELLSLDSATNKVTYRILAAKMEQEYDWKKNETVSTIGSTAECTIPSFATWAKLAFAPEKKAEILADVAVKRLKLSPGEKQVMVSIHEEFKNEPPLGVGSDVSFTEEEARAAKGLEKKGLGTVNLIPGQKDGMFCFTQFGISWLKAYAAGVIS